LKDYKSPAFLNWPFLKKNQAGKRIGFARGCLGPVPRPEAATTVVAAKTPAPRGRPRGPPNDTTRGRHPSRRTIWTIRRKRCSVKKLPQTEETWGAPLAFLRPPSFDRLAAKKYTANPLVTPPRQCKDSASARRHDRGASAAGRVYRGGGRAGCPLPRRPRRRPTGPPERRPNHGAPGGNHGAPG